MKKIAQHAIPTGAMADIAFLLLIFFFTTTEIYVERGIRVTLPPIDARGGAAKEHVFHVHVNRNNEILAGNTITNTEGMVEILRNKVNQRLMAGDAKPLVVSLHCDRETRYHTFFEVHVGIQIVLHEAWDSLGMREYDFLYNNLSETEQSEVRKRSPIVLSEAD